MKRREFIGLLCGVPIAFSPPSCAIAQERVRRIGVLTAFSEFDPEGQVRLAVLRQRLRQLGWVEGRNLLIAERWAAGDPSAIERYAAELTALHPDVILSTGTPVTAALQRRTRTIPLVFTQVTDPIGSGIVPSLSHPGGNTTGFSNYASRLGGKWLELLKDIAPRIDAILVIANPHNATGADLFRAIQIEAGRIGVAALLGAGGDAAEVDRSIESFANTANGGLIVLPDGSLSSYRDRIIALAAKHRLPACYPFRYFPASGGLFSYGSNAVDLFGRAANYVDRILAGQMPGDLPIQAPIEFELILNLRTATALDLDVPPTFLARTSEIIQ